MLLQVMRFIATAVVCAAVFGGCQASGSTGTGGGTGGGGTYVCTPACNGATCGNDGCGGTCGSCGSGQVCAGGKCQASGGGGPTCSDDCQTSSCLNSTTVSKCAYGSDGCKHAQSVACPGGQICKAGLAICGQCLENDECEANQVCAAGACKNYSGLKYTFTISSLKIPINDDTGTKWDPAGLPDPFVCLTVNDEKIGCTTSKQDTLDPYWGSQISTTLYSTDEVGFAVYDEDLTSDDFMGGVAFTNIQPLLHSGGDESDLFLGNAQTSSFQLTWSVSAN